ncbi:MAG: phospholipid carrier-dependent glycosyltransferase [Candidatus Bathyarchaeota archaeon]|nr:phospholipid carrier-dependent glycosyltransferase [Candidatus Bathyarchaeota archaeon]
MKFELKITKTDILTIVLLSVLFFGMAAWNLGRIDAPTTDWETTSWDIFYVDLGSVQQVQNVIFWVKMGNASVQVFSGEEPGAWNPIGNFSLQDRATDYQVQKTIPINTNARYLRLDIVAATFDSRPNFSNWGVTNPTDKEPSPYIQITEIGVSSPSNTQVPITSIMPIKGGFPINGSVSDLNTLIDEQSLLEVPPTYMSKMYFDEVYFARAAEDYVNHVFPLERTHPPLGKLIQAIGVVAFGETPFGWRIMGVIFGTLMVPLMYLLGKKLFGTWIGGFSAAFLFTFDFMHFTMARIGTVDTYVVFFSLLSQLFFLVYFSNVLKNGWKTTSVLPLLLAVVFFALGFSTKWFILWGTAGLLALLVAVRFREIVKLKGTLSDKYVAFFSRPFLLLLGCIGVVAAIYFATYIPEMLMGNSPLTIFNLQNAMFSFHSGSVTDSAAAPWWSWPFMFRFDGASVPRWFDITYLPNGTVSTITVFGNPAVWWVGFVAIVVLADEAFHVRQFLTLIKYWLYRLSFKLLHRKARFANLVNRISNSTTQKPNLKGKGWDATAIYIVVVFLFSWLTYVFVGRATYIYHYYLSVPLICFATTYFINKYWHKPLGKVAAIIIFAATVAMFLAFYPVISGAPASTEYIHNLKWFPSWFFAP